MLNCRVCGVRRPPTSIYSFGMVGCWKNIPLIRMQQPWGNHQKTTCGSWRREARRGVWAYPRCGHPLMAPPHDCLSHGGCMLGLVRVYRCLSPFWSGKLWFVGFSPHVLYMVLLYALSECALWVSFHVLLIYPPAIDQSPKLIEFFSYKP